MYRSLWVECRAGSLAVKDEGIPKVIFVFFLGTVYHVLKFYE
jgi:hypothetical protein